MPEDEGTASLPHDRRAPILAQYQVELEAGRYAQEVANFARSLGDLNPGCRRRTRILVGQFVGQWLAEHGPFGVLLIVVSLLEHRVRVEIAAENGDHSPGFWDSLLTPHIRELSTDCGVDRRRGSGVWFELEDEISDELS